MSKQKRIAFLFLLAILIIPFLSMVVRAVYASIWDSKSHINIAVDSGDLLIWSIEPKEASATIITIPKTMYLSVSPYGSYRAAALGKLSLLEKKDGTLVKKAIEESLAIPIDATILYKEGGEEIPDLRNFFGTDFFATVAQLSGNGWVTNLSGLDLIRLWFFSFSLRKESIATVDLSTLSAASEFTLPDGTNGLLVDKERSSKVIKTYVEDVGIVAEQVSIEIVNAKDVVGFANDIALLIENIGGNVINVSKSEEKKYETIVFASKKGYTATRIAKIVSGKLLYEEPKESRADIVVVLGGQ